MEPDRRPIASLALPKTGVVSLGWSDDSHVEALVRVPGSAVKIVVCPVTGTACSTVLDAPDVATGWVVSARH